jgi:hypothetical protein
MAGGYKMFGPTYNSTPYVRLGYEGILNGAHEIDPALVEDYEADETAGQLAGKFVGITADGVNLASEGGDDAVGLFREDMKDMVNASFKATFYFRGGEYYVNAVRIPTYTALNVGDKITAGAGGVIKEATGTEKVLGVVTHKGAWANGNMFANAPDVPATQGGPGEFIGFIMYI